MIRYAITAGQHGLFRKRESDRLGAPAGCPALSDVARSEDGAGPDPGALPAQVRHLAQQGVRWIQLREKHLAAGALAALARELMGVLDEVHRQTGCQTRLLINARADVAAATGAHGVHLPATPGGLTPEQVRGLYRSLGLPRPDVSLACHSLPEVRRAAASGVDLILFSPVFGKWVDDVAVSPARGLEALAAACALAAPVPVLALGGVTHANTAACLGAGAAGVAGIRLFSPSPPPSAQG